MAQWMIDNGSDVHQGGDGPLMRAALKGDRIPMMELLLRNGADVNAEWVGILPIIFAPCETLDAAGRCNGFSIMAPIRTAISKGENITETALDYLSSALTIALRTLGECIEILLSAGCPTTRYDHPAVLDILRGTHRPVSRRNSRTVQACSAKRFPDA